ncbi:MAG: helix-turn-helix domain-containing protein [Planctomycetes bacterium]|nr:helix-turn-helix domain-containing protein [Planctomycetota bacterium]
MDRGLSQSAMARLLGVDAATILNWERNKTQPGPARLRSLCQFLGYFPEAIPTDLPSRIRAARHLLGLNQDQLAERLGVNPSTVQKWEHGRKRPYPRFVRLFEDLVEQSGLPKYAV